MKYLLVLIVVFLMSGCASISEYNQGCRDGVSTFVQEVLKGGIEEKVVVKGCDALDQLHKQKMERTKP